MTEHNPSEKQLPAVRRVPKNSRINLLDNPWHNVYWFARMLINSDQYGGIGSNSQRMIELAASIQTAFDHSKNSEQQLEILRRLIQTKMLSRTRKGTKKRVQVEHLVKDVLERIETVKDVEVFSFTCAHVMVPINEAINNVPNDDKKFAEDIVRSFLDRENEHGLMTVINLWDKLGIEGSLNAERIQIVRSFGDLRRKLSEYIDTQDQADMILTAFVQEFERRVGQKRKSRGGRSLEDVTSFILDYFNIPTTHAPDHFQADIEVDKWIRTSDNWYVGISCKRTLRERWKQVSSADASSMGRYKIKELWHVVTHAGSLSDDMLSLLGGNRHVFYLPDNSDAYFSALQHTVLQNYVRPLTQFIQDLRAENPK